MFSGSVSSRNRRQRQRQQSEAAAVCNDSFGMIRLEVHESALSMNEPPGHGTDFIKG
jgi:hypothetical protein